MPKLEDGYTTIDGDFYAAGDIHMYVGTFDGPLWHWRWTRSEENGEWVIVDSTGNPDR